MKTYWDYSEHERAQMTEEQVRGFEPFELMEAGIVRTPNGPLFPGVPDNLPYVWPE